MPPVRRLLRPIWAMVLGAALPLVGCSQPAGSPTVAPPPPAVSASALTSVRFHAVLVAGDGSEPVFDNAVAAMAAKLQQAGVPPPRLHRFSADERRHGSAVAAAPPAALGARLAQLPVEPGDGCFLFLTSHGARGQGLVLGRQLLSPAALDGMLAPRCAAVPTVVIVSGCYSGDFAAPPLARPNRIVLTAARRDRASFGCRAGRLLTIFDQCLLGALDGAQDWAVIAARARGCVGTREAAEHASPASEPQAAFGEAVAAWPGPWRTQDVAVRDSDLESADWSRLDALATSAGGRDTLARYKSAVPTRALAATADLRWFFWRSAGAAASPTAAARAALQGCEWLYGGACALYAVDDRITRLDATGVPPIQPPLLPRSGRFDAAAVPFVGDADRPGLAAYRAATSPKALAIAVGNGRVGQAAASDLAQARQAALQQCRAAGGLDCVIYAQNDDVVLGYR